MDVSEFNSNLGILVKQATAHSLCTQRFIIGIVIVMPVDSPSPKGHILDFTRTSVLFHEKIQIW